MGIMKVKYRVLTAVVVSLICIVSLMLVYPFFSSNISLVRAEKVGGVSNCFLQWHGVDGAKLELTTLWDLGRGSHDYVKVVNDGDIFNVTVVEGYQWVEIHYYGKTVAVHYHGLYAL